jgi:glycosyltransferase involved in cell wall biosynthesis
VLFALDRAAEALDAFQSAVNISPKYADAWANLGMALAARDEAEMNTPSPPAPLPEGEGSKRPSPPAPFTGREGSKQTSAHARFPEGEGSEACFRRALQCQPWHRDAVTRLASLLQRQGRPEEAGSLLQSAIAAAPCAEFHLALGNLRAAAGKGLEAAEHYRTAIAGSVPPQTQTAEDANRLVYDGTHRTHHALRDGPRHKGDGAGQIAFVSPHCVLDFTNGAATATLDALVFLQSLGFACQAFCNSRLDAWEEVRVEEVLARRGLRYEVCNAQIGAYRGRLIFTTYSSRGKGDSPICADTQIGTVPRLPVTLFNSASTRGGWACREEAAAFLSACEIFLKRNRPGLIWTYGGDPVSMAVQALVKQFGIPILFALHNFSYYKAEPFRLVDRVVVPTEYARRHYRETLGLECDVLPLVVDPGRVNCGADCQSASRYVTFVNPTPLKGIYIFARIAELLSQQRPDIPLLVVEGSSKASFLPKLGIDLSGVKNLRFMPNTPNARQFFAATKLLLMPSLMENAALTAMEAMFNGIPVLASNRGGLPETVGNAGVLFDIPARYTPETRDLPSAQEVAPWVETIIRLWDDAAEYGHWSRAACQRAQAWHPDRLAPIYRDCLSRLAPRFTDGPIY